MRLRDLFAVSRLGAWMTVFGVTGLMAETVPGPSTTAVAATGNAGGAAEVAVADKGESNTAAGAMAEAAESAGGLRYRLSRGEPEWDEAIRARIVRAMDEAVAIYRELGVFDKAVIANYNPATPTADANYNGWINFGGQIGTRVALHEISHTLGVGTHRRWRSLIEDGKWTGEHALAQLREFDGPDAVLFADRQHFWPYGLNFDREDGGPEDRRRHVLMVAAFQRDLGITPAPETAPETGGAVAEPVATP